MQCNNTYYNSVVSRGYYTCKRSNSLLFYTTHFNITYVLFSHRLFIICGLLSLLLVYLKCGWTLFIGKVASTSANQNDRFFATCTIAIAFANWQFAKVGSIQFVAHHFFSFFNHPSFFLFFLYLMGPTNLPLDFDFHSRSNTWFQSR